MKRAGAAIAIAVLAACSAPSKPRRTDRTSDRDQDEPTTERAAEDKRAAELAEYLYNLEVPEPTKLAAVYPPCDPTAIDLMNPDCKAVCAAEPYAKHPECKDKPRPKPPVDDDPPETPPEKKAYPAPVAEIVSAGTRTQITLSIGSSAGIKVGMFGLLFDKSGAVIPQSGFAVARVTARESFATIALPLDKVKTAASAILK